MPETFFLLPRVEAGRGGGHLVRCAMLALALRERGREAFLYINKKNNSLLNSFVSSTLALVEGFDPAWVRSGPPEQTAIVIIDGLCTSGEELEKWTAFAPVFGIDEGGQYRRRFDFLVDLLPGLYRPEAANLKAPGFLPLPCNRRPGFSAPKGVFRILISFGAEDSAGLAAPSAKALSISRDAEITLLGESAAIGNVIILKRIPRLREHLAEYDLLITHYGLGAFEALRAGIPVILVSPTSYHEKLAAKAGFISAGIGKRASGRIGRLLIKHDKKTGRRQINYNFVKRLLAHCEKLAELYSPEKTAELISKAAPQLKESATLADYLVSSSPVISRACRASCQKENGPGKKSGPVIARFPDRSYRRCPFCGLISMDRISPPPIEYTKDYFFDLYKKQYGKTYLEDFPNLVEAGKKRLKNIKPLLKCFAAKSAGAEERGRPRILDIGCAYGPFLSAAKNEGFDPEGIEPAEDAALYVREKLGLPCRHGFFPDALEKSAEENKDCRAYDAVTLWYVIEHFENPGIVLREINRVLKSGGVLAFSTPSYSGVSGRASLDAFLKNSPADHWTVWRPGISGKLLKKYGFTVKKIVVSGHHPERFPLIGTHLKKGSFLFSLTLIISKLFRLGDSFEVYAVKNK